MRCKFCYVSFFNKRLNDMSIEIIQKAAKLGFDIITFSGGDPFSKSKFREACIEAKMLGLQTHVDTNALAIREEDISFIEDNIDILGISIDGVGEIHNELRESKNSFGKIEHLLSVISETKTTIKVNTVLTKENVNCLNELSSFLRQYPQVTIWSIYQFFPLDAASKYKDRFFIDNDEFTKRTSTLQINTGLKMEVLPYSNRVNGYLFVNELGQMFTNSLVGEYFDLGSIFTTEFDSLESKLKELINPRTIDRYNKLLPTKPINNSALRDTTAHSENVRLP